jgi:hypothetical protein
VRHRSTDARARFWFWRFEIHARCLAIDVLRRIHSDESTALLFALLAKEYEPEVRPKILLGLLSSFIQAAIEPACRELRKIKVTTQDWSHVRVALRALCTLTGTEFPERER